MTISKDRKKELKWYAIDAAFCHMEHFYEMYGEELSQEEESYMRKVIISMAKYVGIDNHILIT